MANTFARGRPARKIPPKPQGKFFAAETRPGIKDFRLIVRNLDDFTKREELQDLFSKCGRLKEIVQLPSKIKKDAFAPFAFVQYTSRIDAERAINRLNGSDFKGRKISVGISVDKETYIARQIEEKQNKTSEVKPKVVKFDTDEDEAESEITDDDSDEDVIPDETDEESDADLSDDEEKAKPVKNKKKAVPVRNGPMPEIEDLVESSEEEEDDHGAADESRSEDSDNSESGEVETKHDNLAGDMETPEDEEDDGDELSGPPAKKAKTSSERPKDLAVTEGRVVFLRNLSYDTDDDSLKEAVEQFGEVALAITCKYKDSNHPTGTAFVHFKEKEGADSCLAKIEEAEGLVVDNRKVFGYRAVPREEASAFKKPEKHSKDNRNLYLLRTSVIRPGSAQAQDMSEEDSTKRASLIQSAKLKLKNLHFFVSPTRLAIHNVPYSMTDRELKKICLESSKNPNAYINECRIMRKKISNNAGGHLQLGSSKGYAFVDFSTHEDALKCLSIMNNNKKLFKEDRRPIVEFSIENKAALRIKERRLTQSKAKPGGEEVAIKNEAALEKTKRAMMAGGAKPLPKKFTAKLRGKANNKKKERHQKKSGSKKAKKNR